MKNTIITLSTALLVTAFGTFGFAHGSGDGYGYGEGMMGPGMMYGYGGNWIWMIIQMVFWIVLIIGIVFLIRWLFSSTKTIHTKSGDSALEILKRRYAKGEINKEEFEQKKRDIE